MQTRLINYKIINRIYWIPNKMAQLGLRNLTCVGDVIPLVAPSYTCCIYAP